MKLRRSVLSVTLKLLVLSALCVLSGCASAPPVVAKCPEIPVPPPQLTAPKPEVNYLCKLGLILDQPSLCSPKPASETTTTP